jgi:hypothetical protein
MFYRTVKDLTISPFHDSLPQALTGCQVHRRSIMPLVQDVIVLFQTTPALDSQVVAWARYEASKGDRITDLVEEPDPPYNTAVEAMRDGWQVIQMSELKHRTREDGYELGPLPYQTVISKFNPLLEKETHE